MIYLRPYFMDKPIDRFTYRIDEISFTLLQIVTFLVLTGTLGRCVYIIVTDICKGYVKMVKEIENARAFWNRNKTGAVAEAESKAKSQQDQQPADQELRITAIERRITELERQNIETLQKRAQEMQQRKRRKMEEEGMDHVLIERIEAVGWDA